MKTDIEIFLDGKWVLAASIEKTSSHWWFEYAPEYVFSGHGEPISLARPVAMDLASETGMPSFLFDLTPQGKGRNFLLGIGHLVDDCTDETNLKLAMMGAFNPIGRLRLSSAVDFYESRVDANIDADILNGFDFQDVVARQDDFLNHLWLHAMLHAGTTGAQGAAPKFLLTESKDGRWFADAIIGDSEAKKHWIVKMPRGHGVLHEKVLRNECAYINVARKCQIRSMGEPMLHGKMLFIPRFDRAVNGSRVLRFHQESLASAAKIPGFGLTANQFDLANVIARFSSHPAEDVAEFIKRDILNIALGNTDNHAGNTAFQINRDNNVSLTPFFDFSPMFADPEMIIRGCRWMKGHKEIHDLEEIVDLIRLSDKDKQYVADKISSFSDIGKMIEIMQDCGVDGDIIENRKPFIDNQASRIESIGGNYKNRSSSTPKGKP